MVALVMVMEMIAISVGYPRRGTTPEAIVRAVGTIALTI